MKVEMSEPKFKQGDQVNYVGKLFVIDKLLCRHEKGWMYQLVGLSNLAVLESVLTGETESIMLDCSKEASQ